MAEKFYSILTNIGKAKVANSIGLGTKINFAKMKIGDGGGAYYEPTESQIDLKHTVWEGNINHVEVDKKNPNWIHIEVMIPSTIGGFTIREYGAYDNEGDLIGICKCAETYKPVIADGSTKELLLDLILCVVNTDTVELKIDPTIIFAKKGEVEQLRTDIEVQLKEIANKVDNIKIADATTTTKGIVKLNTAINSTSTTEASTPSAIKQAYDKGIEALNKANEAFTSASNGKTYIAGKVGNVTSDNTFTQIGDRIQTDKNTAASALNAKNISASGNETLASLVGKIGNINIQGMGGAETEVIYMGDVGRWAIEHRFRKEPECVMGTYYCEGNCTLFMAKPNNKYGFRGETSKAENGQTFYLQGSLFSITHNSSKDAKSVRVIAIY